MKNLPLTIDEKVMLGINIILQLSLAGAIFFALYEQNWLNAFLIIVILVITLVPTFIKKSYKVNLPLEFELVGIAFIYGALYLGEFHSYYTLYWWWDIVLHTTSGFLLGYIGFLLIYLLNRDKKIPLHMTPGLMALFAGSFAIAMGAIWEIVEFTIDSVVPYAMMQDSLSDTMWDLIVDSVGAIIVAISGYFYIQKGIILPFNQWIDKFVKRNPIFFRHIKEKIKQRKKHFLEQRRLKRRKK